MDERELELKLHEKESKYSGAIAEVCLFSSECNFNAMLARREANPRSDTLSYGSLLNSSCLLVITIGES